jgi:hypothetical protein
MTLRSKLIGYRVQSKLIDTLVRLDLINYSYEELRNLSDELYETEQAVKLVNQVEYIMNSIKLKDRL